LAAVRRLGFWKFKFLTVWAVKRPILHNHAKFREHLPIRCCDIAIFVVFQDDDRRHLVFFLEKLEIFTVCHLSGANLRHRATFHQNRPNGFGDMAL